VAEFPLIFLRFCGGGGDFSISPYSKADGQKVKAAKIYGQIAVFGEMFKSPTPPPPPNRKKIIKNPVLNTESVKRIVRGDAEETFAEGFYYLGRC